ncbi:unnamed protein product, partial [Discosporangium mesarthrocarpum]
LHLRPPPQLPLPLLRPGRGGGGGAITLSPLRGEICPPHSLPREGFLPCPRGASSRSCPRPQNSHPALQPGPAPAPVTAQNCSGLWHPLASEDDAAFWVG